MNNPRIAAFCFLLFVLYGAHTGAAGLAQLERNGTDIEERITTLLETMTIEQKVGQMIQGDIRYLTPEDVRRYSLGSVLNGGGAFPDNNKYAMLQDWVALADSYYQASLDTSLGSAGIPILWGTDAVHGNNNLIGATIFPHNIGLGAANDPELMVRIGPRPAHPPL